jgi:hypothetical protein
VDRDRCFVNACGAGIVGRVQGSGHSGIVSAEVDTGEALVVWRTLLLKSEEDRVRSAETGD